MKQNEKQAIEKCNKSKSLFFENINKIDKPLARLIKEERMRAQTMIIRNEREHVLTDPKDIKKAIRKHYEQLQATKT